jgi:hypothetical protein
MTFSREASNQPVVMRREVGLCTHLGRVGMPSHYLAVKRSYVTVSRNYDRSATAL